MPGTIYYRTFPLSKQPRFPNTIYIPENRNAAGSKRSRTSTTNMREPMGLGPPAKLARHAVVVKEQETTKDQTDNQWVCTPSTKALRTGKKDFIQEILQPIIDEIQPGAKREDKKDPISLATADASLSHIPPCPKAMEAIVRAVLRKPHTTLYTHSCGTLEARRAIASHHRAASPEDVIVTNGCSAALDLAFSSILDPGSKLLVPNPGFPLYEELAESHGAKAVKYQLDAHKNWECDMEDLERILWNDKNNNNKEHGKIRAMVINNPSSHGAVFSKTHLVHLLNFALKHKLLLISDEVYGDMTFGSNVFHPLASIAAQHGRRVPIITTSGLSKQFLVPGWRLGWIVFQDNQWGSLRQIQDGAQRLAKLQHGVSHLMQSVIPAVLSPTTPGIASWKNHLNQSLEQQAKLVCSKLESSSCPGLELLSRPQGSMYAIVHLKNSNICDGGDDDDVEFCRKLVRQENLFLIPGTSFGLPGTIRIAFSASPHILETACSRIAEFCQRNYPSMKQESV